MQILAQIHERHKQFHQRIARRAAALQARSSDGTSIERPVAIIQVKPEPPPPPAKPMFPPVPDHLMVEAHRVLKSPAWDGSILKIQRAVCADYGVSMNDLVSSRRTADIVRPRQVAVYLCRRLTVKSLPEIGRKFGGRDHTTMIAAIRRIERLIASDQVLHARINSIEASLGGEIV